MNSCSFDKLLQLMDKKLDLDGQLEVLDHLDRCEVCRETVYLIRRDRDEGLFVYKPYHMPSLARIKDVLGAA